MPRFTLFKTQPTPSVTLKQYYYPEEQKISIERAVTVDEPGETLRLTFQTYSVRALDISIMRIRRTTVGMRTQELSTALDKKQLGVLLERLKAVHENMED